MASKGGIVNQSTGLPPAWAEFLLERMLARADSQIVSGDLREEYAEAILPRIGTVRADFWYLRHVLSFVPRSISQHANIRRTLLFVSVFTSACGCWLAFMELSLRHAGYPIRFGIDLLIALIPVVVITVLFFHLGIRAERWLWIAAISLIALAVQAIVRNARSVHFEGFVLLISLVLVLQGILMLTSLGRPAHGIRGRIGGKGSLHDPNDRFSF